MRSETSGNVAIITAFALAVILAFAGAAIEQQQAAMTRAQMQAATDAAVLAAAIADGDLAAKQARASAVFEANTNGRFADASLTLSIARGVHTATVPYAIRTGLLKVIGQPSLDVGARSSAAEIGGPICIIALDTDLAGAVRADSNAQIRAPNCELHANSSHAYSVLAQSNSFVETKLACTVGGFSGGEARFSPAPQTGCPQIGDPLANVPTPPSSGCSQTNFMRHDYSGVIQPGIYCNGLRITGNSDILANPGVYVVKDGPLLLDGTSRLEGAGVMFYLVGASAIIEFNSDSTVILSAPDSGTYEGVLFFEDRGAPLLRTHRIDSNSVGSLLGALYFPRGRLSFNSNATINAGVPWMAIVARQIHVDSNVSLHLEANYAGTSVAVPTRLRRGSVRLTE